MGRESGTRRRLRAPYALMVAGTVLVMVAGLVFATGGAASAAEPAAGTAAPSYSLLGIHLDLGLLLDLGGLFHFGHHVKPPDGDDGHFKPKPPPYACGPHHEHGDKDCPPHHHNHHHHDD